MLEVMFWDVQHGSAAYLKTPKGKHFAIDLGVGDYSGSNEEFSPLMHLKNKYKITQLDEVIITHPHTDHIDDILNFDSLNPRVLSRPKHLTEEDIRAANHNYDSEKIDKYLEIHNRYNQPVLDNENPEYPENNGDVTFRRFHPTKCGTSNINNHSIVTVIEYLNVKIIIPGDNESASWIELLDNAVFVEAIKDADIFLASHHGRESGFYSDLFEHFKPKLVIVSDGAETDTSAVSRYSKVAEGWKVYDVNGKEETRYCLTTRNDGAILVKVGKSEDGVTFMQVTKGY
jgi:competence protein ComEC